MQTRTALITGGTGAIGTAICQELFKQNIKVIAAYNRGGNHEAASAWQKEQQNAGYNIAINYVDVTSFDSCAKLLIDAERQHGAIDILVNNAGVTQDARCCKMDLEAWHKVISTNLNSIFYMTRHIINGMIERHYGRIINISSINGQKGQRGQVNYSASKAGMHGFTKALAQEVAPDVTVNTVSPGYIATDMVMAVPQPIRDKIVAQIPVGRFGQPKEVARVVAFLAAEESSFITGANIAINGGHHMS